uniref:60S acidic ribosomal protein P3 n=1 Tax=Ananas comosus var. bracteatus TaxID=296719 RepID=A0A6V7P3K7_ANACO|nr:unnamed protein product [Ananas comosus var. bracteatus]
MGVFTFVCRSSGGEWSAKQLSGDLEASAATPYELQRRLVQAAAAADSSGGIQSSFSLVTPSSAVFQVVIGGGGGGAFIGGGAASAGGAATAGGGAAAPEAPPAEEKKEEKEESDEDMASLSSTRYTEGPRPSSRAVFELLFFMFRNLSEMKSFTQACSSS